MHSLRDTREAGKDSLDSLQGTREAPGRHQGGGKRSRGRRSCGGILAERTNLGTRQAPGRQERTREVGKNQLDSLGGTREAPGRQERVNWTACEAPGRHQGGRKGPIGQPGRHQDQLDSLRDTREAGKNHLNSLGGTRETRSTGLPIGSRFWKGAGFCITVNTISMAIGSVRGGA